MQQAVCPLCGGGLSYEPSEYEDEYEFAEWKCNECGATGTEVCDIKFALHQDVKDADGNEVELREPMHLFWVCWISRDRNGITRMSAMYDSCLTLDEAMSVVEKVKAYHDAVMVWIDETAGSEKIGTPYIEPLVDALGQRRKVAKHDEAGNCGENAKAPT